MKEERRWKDRERKEGREEERENGEEEIGLKKTVE